MSKPVGDSFQSFTLSETEAGNAEAVAARISGWLVARGIVMADDVATQRGVTGFSPGPHAERALSSEEAGWRDIGFNDIHVDVRRRVTAAVQGGLGPIFCPHCASAMGDAADVPPAFMHAVDEWDRGEGGLLSCPVCKSSTPIAKWRTEPFWAFGNVTITFWNWPQIKESFVHEVEALAGQPVKVVRGKI